MVTEEVKERLEPVSKMLAGDGYELRVELHDDGLIAVVVEATPDACVDCLVPSEVMEGVLRANLGEDELRAGGHELTVKYPAESAAPSGRSH
jgi:hypothetical protein